jgi:cob(I)alamin adenosyltransferase
MQTDANDSTAHRERMQALKLEQDRKIAEKSIERGVILVNTGDGKGKSTAAFGLAMRAAGVGHRVLLVQFIKGRWKTGEGEAIKRFPEITHVVSGEGFTWNTQDRDKDIAATRKGWQTACEAIEAARADPSTYQLIILDELNVVLRYDYLPLDEVLPVLSNKPEALSIAITGRDAKPEIIALADTVTDMRCVKHAFDAGIAARRGIEF